jgi:hypothetical protein
MRGGERVMGFQALTDVRQAIQQGFCRELSSGDALGGESSLSVQGLSGKSVELFDRTEACLPPAFKLTLAQHMHQLNAGEDGLSSIERFEP